MKATLGHGASTCSYTDWLHADLIVLFGSNVANNQPVTTKYLHHAKKNGAQIAVVNPYREPGLERYWIPSIAAERAARHGAGRSLVRRAHGRRPGVPASACCGRSSSGGGVDDAFVASTRRDSSRRARGRRRRDWEAIERESGMTRAAHRGVRGPAHRAAERDVRLVDGPDAARARRRHREGAGQRRPRARPARPAERGLVPDPRPLRRAGRRRSRLRASASTRRRARAWAAAWGFPVPERPRLDGRRDGRARRREGGVDLFWIVGGNFLETLRDSPRSRRALARPRLRVHQDIVLSSSMLAEGDGDVLLLPATTRYESPGGGTETSTERRIIFSPEIPGRRIGSAQAGVVGVSRGHGARAARIRAAPGRPRRRRGDSPRDCRAVPLYAGIETLAAKGDQVQWGGRTALRRRPLRDARRQGAFRAGVAAGRGIVRRTASWSRRAAASSSTRWCSATVDPLTGAARRRHPDQRRRSRARSG